MKKDTLTRVFSYEFYETFKNTLFHTAPPVAAFGIYTNRDFLF